MSLRFAMDPPFVPGQRVAIKRDHPGCTWCEAVRGRSGVVVRMVALAEDLQLADVQLDGTLGAATRAVLFKADCLEACS